MDFLTEGAIADFELRDAMIRFRVGLRYFEAPDQRELADLAQRPTVRILARESVRDFNEVLVIQWRDQPPHYVGITLPLPMHLLWAGLLIVALAADSPFLLLAPLGLMGVHGLLSYRKMLALSEFARQLATRRILAVPKTPADVPLAVEMPATTGIVPAEVLEFTHDAIILWELKGAGIIYWNRAAEQLYGVARKDALGRVTHDLLQTQFPGGMAAVEQKLLRYGVWGGDLSHRCANGERLTVEARLALLSSQQSPRLVLEVNRVATVHSALEPHPSHPDPAAPK